MHAPIRMRSVILRGVAASRSVAAGQSKNLAFLKPYCNFAYSAFAIL
jgi:hypothetical protein